MVKMMTNEKPKRFEKVSEQNPLMAAEIDGNNILSIHDNWYFKQGYSEKEIKEFKSKNLHIIGKATDVHGRFSTVAPLLQIFIAGYPPEQRLFIFDMLIDLVMDKVARYGKPQIVIPSKPTQH